MLIKEHQGLLRGGQSRKGWFVGGTGTAPHDSDLFSQHAPMLTLQPKRVSTLHTFEIKLIPCFGFLIVLVLGH